MQPVNSTSPTKTGGGGENVNRDRVDGQPVVDLLQIYPGKTNNLDILTFEDLNVMESRPLCCSSCDMCGLRLRNYEEFMMGLISSVAVILFIAMWIIVGEVASWWYNQFWYLLLFWMMPCIILIISKLYILRKFMLFRRKKQKDGNSIEYHRLGGQFYFSFYGDAMFSLLVSAWWFVILFNFCVFSVGIGGRGYGCARMTSFDQSVIVATITWFGMVPLLIYSIAGYFLVYRMNDSDFETYNKNWAKRRWDMTNDVKYMLNYHHTEVLPATNTVLCRTICVCNCPCCNSGRDCSSNSDTYSCCCHCCNTCDGVRSCTCCCCGTDCCSDGIKCSLIAISVYFIIVSIGSLYFLIIFVYILSWLFSSSLWWFYLFDALLFLTFFLAGSGYHFLPGYYAIALVNYKFKCCKTGNAHAVEIAIAFHDLAIKASKAYAALAAFYYYAFMVYLFMFTIPRWFWYFSIWSFFEVGLSAFISWLPFEALKLIDTFIKKENYQRKHDQNSINMDVFDFKTAALQLKGGTNNISTNGQPVPIVEIDPKPNDANIVTALQVATHH